MKIQIKSRICVLKAFFFFSLEFTGILEFTVNHWIVNGTC